MFPLQLSFQAYIAQQPCVAAGVAVVVAVVAVVAAAVEKYRLLLANLASHCCSRGYLDGYFLLYYPENFWLAHLLLKTLEGARKWVAAVDTQQLKNTRVRTLKQLRRLDADDQVK